MLPSPDTSHLLFGAAISFAFGMWAGYSAAKQIFTTKIDKLQSRLEGSKRELQALYDRLQELRQYKGDVNLLIVQLAIKAGLIPPLTKKSIQKTKYDKDTNQWEHRTIHTNGSGGPSNAST